MEINKPVFVLVHGAGLGGWCWERVERILCSQNYEVLTPTLIGTNARENEAKASPTLQTYIQEIIDIINFQDLRNIILVGHSFGGMVITGVADKLSHRIRRVIYLDAAVPKNGDDFASHIPGISLEDAERRRQVFLSMARDRFWIDPIDPRLAGITNNEDIEWVNQLSIPHPVNTWLEKVTLETAENQLSPLTYVLATNPPTELMGYPAHGLIAQSSDKWTYREIDCGHAMMIIEPEKTANLLMEAIQT